MIEFWETVITVLIKISQLLLSLSILVVLHEMGHYLAARYFKTRVEKFYLFMNPWFSLYKKQIGETEWGIGWLPLGGYVKISGMVDESMDEEQMKLPPKPYEFRSKPAWQRLIIMLGGIIVNLIVGFLIYSMVLFSWGETVTPNEFALDIDPKLEKFGFQNGDQIIKYNGEEITTFDDIRRKAFFNIVTQATVIRDGVEITLPPFEQDLGRFLINEGVKIPFSPRIPAVISNVVEGSRAEAAGLQEGDVFLAVGDIKTTSIFVIQAAIKSQASSPILLQVERNDSVLDLPAMTDSLGRVGFSFENGKKQIDYTFGQSIVGGFHLASNTIREYGLSMRLVFSSAGSKQVGSLLTFASVFDGGEEDADKGLVNRIVNIDWEHFWRMTAFFSLILAFMNLLPIPALDGGHVVFLLYEMIVGKPAPDKILEIAQVIGMILLLGLMVFALGNDFVRLFNGELKLG
jgi:regulator of sigma E protease